MQLLKKRHQQGQAVLIVLLVVAVALGFGLSIISQSITDIEIAGHSEESARVFNAAEAGIENALGSLSSLVIGTDYNLPIPISDVDVTYSVSSENSLEGGYSENDIATVFLGGANTLTIEWGESSESCPGAASLLVTVINSANNIERYGWNACALNADNGMEDISDIGADGYLRTKELSVNADDVLVKIRPIYNLTKIRVTAAAALPVQAYDIDSRAHSTTLESKAIQVSRTVPVTPAIFDYVLFSGTNIVK